jgi:hypothetical protein
MAEFTLKVILKGAKTRIGLGSDQTLGKVLVNAAELTSSGEQGTCGTCLFCAPLFDTVMISRYFVENIYHSAESDKRPAIALTISFSGLPTCQTTVSYLLG